MGVMMQAFYWDCPKVDNKEFTWWRVRWCAMLFWIAVWIFTRSRLWLLRIYKALVGN